MARQVVCLLVYGLALASLSSLARAQSTCSGFEANLLLSSDLAQADRFGDATAMDGDVLVVGAPRESQSFGAAYVFRWNGAAWDQEQKLMASNGAALQEFGGSVAVDGNVIVVGSPGQNCQETAYVFRYDGALWQEEQQLTPSAISFCNRFGLSVAVSRDVVAVGAERDETYQGTQDAGSAFVFRFDGTQWNEEQKLVPANIASDDRFGHSVAVDGERLIVGAPRRTFFPNAPSPGSVYSFRRSAGIWILEQELSASDGFPSNGFGETLALEGGTLAVGALASYVPGAVYLYEHDGSAWSGEKKVQANDGASSNEFASSVALSGSRLVVGARNDGAQGTAAGAAYLFLEVGGVWSQALKLLTTDGVNGNRLGGAAALAGERLVLGSDSHDIIGSDSGAAFVYDLGALPACPLIYCSAKTTSFGCLPGISYLGSPSATSTGPFSIRAFNVHQVQPGMLVYGLSAASTPFMGGTLCIGAPIRRTVPQTSTGSSSTAVDCLGTLSFGMNHWIRNGFDPSLIPGVSVYAQFWFRDPLDAFRIGLTNALEFVINP